MYGQFRLIFLQVLKIKNQVNIYLITLNRKNLAIMKIIRKSKYVYIIFYIKIYIICIL